MKTKRYNKWFKCAFCPIETDSGYEITPGIIICKTCYKNIPERIKKLKEKEIIKEK